MRIFCIILSVVWGIALFAQDNEKAIQQFDQLAKKKEKTEQDIERMFTVSEEIFGDEPELVLRFLKNIKPVMEQRQYHRNWDNYAYLINQVYSEKGEFREAENIIKKIYASQSENLTDDEKVSVQIRLASLAYHLGEYERSQAIIREFLPLARSDFHKASLYYHRSFNYKELGDMELAVEDMLTVLDLYKSISDWKNVAIAYDSLGSLYKEIQDYEKALFYAAEAAKYAKRSNHELALLSIYNNIGIYHRALKQMDSAIYYYELSNNLAEKYGSNNTLARNLMNMGNVYSEDLRDFTRAEHYYKKSLEICRASGLLYGICLNWYNRGENYERFNHPREAVQAYDSAMVYAVKLNIPSASAMIHEGYYRVYKSLGDHRQALFHHEEFNKIRQQTDIEESRKKIAEIQAKYDLVVKDREIERVHSEIKEQKSRNTILVLIIVLIVLGTASIIYFLVYRNRALRKLYEKNVELLKSPFLFEIPDEEAPESDPAKKLFGDLVRLMETEEVYKESNLTVNRMAARLNTNRNYLSTAIASYANMNFNNFINSYRIKEAKRMILHDSSLTLNEIMYACGFNSRTTFYMAFQKFTGMSPQQFKELSLTRKTKQPEADFVEG